MHYEYHDMNKGFMTAGNCGSIVVLPNDKLLSSRDSSKNSLNSLTLMPKN